jgi:hypothetical protein
MGSFVPAAVDTEYVVPLATDPIAGWVEDAASNHGVVIVAAGTDGGCFDTTEFATASRRPSLSVTWIAP